MEICRIKVVSDNHYHVILDLAKRLGYTWGSGHYPVDKLRKENVSHAEHISFHDNDSLGWGPISKISPYVESTEDLIIILEGRLSCDVVLNHDYTAKVNSNGVVTVGCQVFDIGVFRTLVNEYNELKK